jgi:hypothetical protein
MRGGSAITARARTLRGNLTDAERVLWREHRQRQLGWRFRLAGEGVSAEIHSAQLHHPQAEED